LDSFHVLVVDDEEDFLNTLVKRLNLRHVHASGASRGREALRLIDQEPVDVVVLDVKMPDMGGIEVLREIKNRHPLVEVIMLTGHASLEVAIQGMEAGAFDYLMKPVSMDELLYKLQDAYKKKSIQDEKIRRMAEMERSSARPSDG
jgi:DNA-binding NtrC family response regulator